MSEASWSDLPIDILIKVMELLPYSDQLRSRASCTIWRKYIRDLKYFDTFPWVMAFRPEAGTSSVIGESQCCLYDPAYKKKYAIQNPILLGAKLQTARHNWLLFSRVAENFTSFFFYCPFNDKKIELPEFQKDCHWQRAAFSTIPTSPDCRVVLVRVESRKKLIHMNTCKVGDKKWESLEYPSDRGNIEEVTYMNGRFYFTFADDHTMAGYAYPMLELESYGFVSLGGNMIECHDDGNLLVSFFDCRIRQWRIFRWDQSHVKWFEVENSGYRLWLLNCRSTSVQIDEETIGMVRSTHIHCGGFCFSEFQSRIGYWRPKVFACPVGEGLKGIWIKPPRF